MITSAVNSIEPIFTSPQPQVYNPPPTAQTPAQSVNQVQANASVQPPQPEKKTETPAQAPKPTSGMTADINLRFKINEETQDVTVFMLNRTTREVIRTIPPNELQKLQPGDLISLFA